MKLSGGYQPAVTGRPAATVDTPACPSWLTFARDRDGLTYCPSLPSGATVADGQAIAYADVPGGRVALPAPAAGRLEYDEASPCLTLHVSDKALPNGAPVFKPDRAPARELRQALADGGCWPLIWSSVTGGIPSLDPDSAPPRRVVVTAVAAEPFRARGNVVLANALDSFVKGLACLQRLTAEYGAIHLVLTDRAAPLAASIFRAVAGLAWVHVDYVPVRYPVEHPRLLSENAIRDGKGDPTEPVWVLDAQCAIAVGACLGDGHPLSERLIALGGPAAEQPRHIRARIGTPLTQLAGVPADDPDRLPLRGGLMRGAPLHDADALAATDDAIFVLPRAPEREFLGFARPGFARRSILPCFVSALTATPDRQLSASLRGERRPCIACGLCEQVCPVDLLPQVLHRYLYRDAIDEVEATGLDRCIDCGLCTYVCPSKIELAREFRDARDRIRAEHAAVAAAEAERRQRDEHDRQEREHSEDWRS